MATEARPKDVFDGDEFDPIKYINEKFPDEASLVNLDGVISELRTEVTDLDEEILEGIHEHAMLNNQMKEEITNTKNLTSTIIQEIKSIKEKAIESESIVHDMCMDIKLLDTAKRNLTTSINTLRKFSDLMRSLDNLGDFCAERQYDEAANCLRGINDLVAYFKPFESIPQIKELIDEKNNILSKAKLQIQDDFALFFQGSSNLSTDTLKNGCFLVEIIGQKFRNEILMMPAEMILEPYRKIYTKPENCSIENVEQRYAWFVHELRDFNEKYAEAFPHYWGLINYIVQNYSNMTRVQLMEILQGSTFTSSGDVKSLLNALRATIRFETKMSEDLRSEYQQYLSEERDPNDEKAQYKINQLYKIQGAISSCFEMYMKPYVDSERQELESTVVNDLNKELADPMGNSLKTDEICILNSALLMFNKIKHLLKRASSVSKNQTMFDIYSVVKQTISLYTNSVIEEAYRKEKSRAKNLPFFVSSMCVFINTVDHIKETLGNVNDLIVTLLEAPYTEQVDFSQEDDSCLEIINELIVLIEKIVDSSIESIFNSQMAKMGWEKFDEPSQEASRYVANIKEAMRTVVDEVRGKVGVVHLTKVLTNICKKLNQRFIASVLKFKKISDSGIQQLQRDFNEMKAELEALGQNSEGEPISKIYSRFVQSTSEKATSILKMIATPAAQIPESAKIYGTHISTQEMEKILTNKGFKKNEIQAMLGGTE